MKRKKRSDTVKPRSSSVRREASVYWSGALAIREVYPAEEFAGFESFGEFPEWHPGQAERNDTSKPDFEDK